MNVHRKFLKALPVIALLCIASCQDSKKDNPDPSKNQDNKEMPAKNSEMEMENDGEREALPEDAAGVGAAAQTGGSTGASNNLKMGTENPKTGAAVNFDAMYSELEMTDQQIQIFKTSMGTEQLNTLKNASGELPGNLYEDMESELKTVLDESQFKKYREWKKER